MGELTEQEKEIINKAKTFAKITSISLVAAKNPLLATVASTTANPVLINTLSILSRIYIGSIHFELTEQQVKAQFSEYGFVKSMTFGNDPATGRNKGFSFMEYDTPEAALLSIQHLNGAQICGKGRACKVGRPTNYSPALFESLPPATGKRIYIANVHVDVTEENLVMIFENFGEVLDCRLVPNVLAGGHKTYGFLEYAAQAHAQAAVSSMNNFELGGILLKVALASTGLPMPNGMKTKASSMSEAVNTVEKVEEKDKEEFEARQQGGA